MREKIALEIGSAILTAHEQMDRAERADAHAEKETQHKLRAYSLLAQCIKSDQVPADEVQRIMNEDRAFAEWYKSGAILPQQ